METVAGSESEIFGAADRLARHILAETQDRRLALAGVAGQTTSSLPAFKAYLEGEREFRSGTIRGGAGGFSARHRAGHHVCPRVLPAGDDVGAGAGPRGAGSCPAA